MQPNNPPPPNNPLPRPRIDWVQLLPNIVYGLIALAILIAIGFGLTGSKGFLASLADPQVARGMITFLIAITTVGIAVILTISTIFGADGEAADKRFDRGKQVLSTLIGVLGTIVGFYFGSTNGQPAAPMTLAPVTISNLQPKKGDKITLSTAVAGGKPPYTYTITFDAIIPAIKDIRSTDGTIKQDITIPDNFTDDRDITYQITIKDADNKTLEYNKDGTQKLGLKAK
jgi:hypothetical protein